jgi:AraC family transcriptional regulator
MSALNGNTPDDYRAEYFRRVNAAIDYMDVHFAREVTLDELAAAACFSRFHFHRIFKEITGETVGKYLLRLRLQRAAERLLDHHGENITDVCFACGFSESSVFSRAFRQAYGVSPSQWRKERHDPQNSNHSQRPGNEGQASVLITEYPQWTQQQPQWRMTMNGISNISVRLEDLPDLNLACVRHIGPYSGMQEAYGKLFAWAGPRGLMGNGAKVIGLYLDMPEATPQDKLRADACLTVPEGTQGGGAVVVRKLACKGRYAIGHFEFPQADENFEKAWHAMCAEWLPQSGFQFDDRPRFEIYLDVGPLPGGTFRIDICIPVKPL